MFGGCQDFIFIGRNAIARNEFMRLAKPILVINEGNDIIEVFHLCVDGLRVQCVVFYNQNNIPAIFIHQSYRSKYSSDRKFTLFYAYLI